MNLQVAPALLRVSWEVISWAKSALSNVICIVTLLRTLLIPTHEPSSRL